MYKTLSAKVEEEGNQLINEYGINFYEDFITRNAKALGVTQQQSKNLVMSLKMTKNPEQAKQAVSTFLNNVQTTKQLQASELVSLTNLVESLSDPKFAAFAPDAVAMLMPLAMGLIQRLNKVHNQVQTIK